MTRSNDNDIAHSQIGITAFGGYVPRRRLQRAVVVEAHSWFNPSLKAHAKGERAMANWDEDAITMAVEAARDCLTGIDRTRLASLSLASTSLPFLDRQNSVVVKEALNLSDEIGTTDITSSQRAGTTALINACAAAGTSGPILCIASDKRRTKPASEAELQTGDGAAALLIGTEDPVALLLGSHSHSVDFVDHYRGEGQEFDLAWESRWIREEGYGKIVPAALKAAFDKFPFAPADVAHFVMPCPFKGVAESTARKAGFPEGSVRDNLGAVMGDAGTAHPLVMLVKTLQSAQPGEKIVVVGFGQGCDVLAFEVTDAIRDLTPRAGIDGWLARRLAERNYMKFLSFNGLVPYDRGMRADNDKRATLSVLYRNRKAVLGLVGGRCTKTGSIQFPKTPISVNPNDHAYDTQEDYPLADRACRIMTYTADSLAYSPDPPLYFGTVVFDEGGRVTVDFTDVDPEAVAVGAPMRMMFRIRTVDEARGFTQYFWKAAPALHIAATGKE